MTTRMNLLGMVLVCAALAACASTFKATYDHDAGHDFTNYQTFAWISKNPMQVGATNRIPNPMLEPRIMSALEEALGAKGYQWVKKAEDADFVMSFTVGSREEIKIDSYPSTYAGYGAAYPRRWGGAYYGYGTETNVRQYTKGMLAVDVFDVKERRPVWHGVAEKTINEADREDAEGTIKAAVDAILAGFPPS
ncbi:MAG: DUF4136 domain-containing protein [Gammaproteobacteria bacterium]|nr:DUF4136 domain-containing protein [Gammaproteobacteria bacterium]MDH3750001.1 DUF4136 domain-containing protein [Gammaproteobacteria bacterium]MDH3804537.1 DUF4136 domain-containing protein [Gammaproteobacteria bacterium]